MLRPLRILWMAVVAAGLVGAGWWAASVALRPPDDPVGEPSPVAYTVGEGTVGRSLNFAAVAEWALEDVGRNAAAGVVTSVDISPGDEVAPGEILYTVDLRPVVAAAGVTPGFRDLSLQARGPDVVQLQELLTDLGFFSGSVDGVFGGALRNSVRAWQRSLGVADDGVVRRGDILFLGVLQARLVLSGEVSVGAALGGGEVVVRRVAGDVEFVIPLSPEQRNLVPLSADVEVVGADGVWRGRIVEAVERDAEFGTELVLVLEGEEGGAVCGQDCPRAVPLEGRTNFPARIIVVPETTGPVVPVAAIVTEPDGTTTVRLAGGSVVTVSVVAAADGLAVVEGLAPGDVVLLPVTEG